MKFTKLAEVLQPNKPKPTTMLPDNMTWSWDPNAADWVAVLKDNQNMTPPLYDPNNQNVTNQTTSYMSNIKSASSEITDKNGKKAEEGMWLYKPMVHSTFRGGISVRLFQVKIRHQKDGIDKPYLLSENKLITKGINHVKDGILFDTYEEAKQYSESHKTKEEKEFDKLDDWQKTDYYLSKQSSCLSKFLDGPQYSKEIKIEAGLIKEGLLKYAGFDFNRGTKYAITTKGLEVLRKASEAEHNEALNEREKLAYLFGFNTDEVSTLDTTGKTIKSDEDKLNNERISEAKQYLEKYLLENPELFKYQYGKDNVEEVLKELIEENPNWYKKFSSKKWTICEADGTPLGKVTASSELDAKVKFGIEHPEYAESLSISAKEINAQYEQTTETHEPYPNPSETPTTDVILENHDGWVNTASFEDDIRKQFQQPHQKLPNSDRDLALLEEQILQITDEDTRDTVRKIFDEFQFSDKEAAEKRPYTQEQKRMLPLFRLLNEYVARKEITLEETPDNQPGTVATGQAEVINDLEHKVKDLGFYCEPIAEITDNDYIGADIYSLKIFYK